MSLLVNSLKVGQYMYQRHRNGFRIFKKTSETSFDSISDEIFFSREDARKRVYELNGWKL